MPEIVIPYCPRRQFRAYHDRRQRWACIVAHRRRAGKTVSCINDLQRGAIQCKKPRPRFAYIAPYLKQAKSVAWDYLLHYSSPIPGISVNHSELRVDYPNGGQVRLFGADNAEAMRGIYLDGVVMDEPADMNPRVWPEIIRPALTDRLGCATFIGTPKGHNGFYDVREIARATPDEWFYAELKASQTALIAPDELIAARKLMTEDQYDQEFECSFDAAIQGAYYGKQMRALEEADPKQICRVPWEPTLPVHTAWDLGIGDSTVIWFIQQTGLEVRFIECYANFGMGLEHYAKILKERPYVYGDHVLPHDAGVADLSTGRTRVQTLASLGINARVLERESQIDDGIAAVRSLLPRAWFDAEKCKAGIEALKQYRTEYDDERKVFSNRPLHDWTSDYADAMRYAARGLPDQSFVTKPRDRYQRDRSSGKSAWATL